MTGSLNPGLEGIAVAETRLSQIDGEQGELTIQGFPIDEIAGNARYEETLFLLLNGRLPTSAEYAELRDELSSQRRISEDVQAVLQRAARQEKPAMDALRMGVAAANLGVTEQDTAAGIRRVVAVFPTIVATYWRYRQGKEPVTPRDDMGRAANYLYVLTGEEPSEAAVAGLETYLNTVADHGLNASTFSARVVASTESDLVSAATAAVGTLKGPLHGGAPAQVLAMLREVHETGDVEGYVRDKLDAGERLMGFGHRVYRARDPRVAILESAAKRFYSMSGDADLFETARQFEDVATDLLAEHVPDRRLETNVEFYTGTLLDGLGVPKDLFTATFAISRVGGWMAHAVEQLDANRLIRPTAHYVGDTQRSWIPVAER
jgi:citrate synthase